MTSALVKLKNVGEKTAPWLEAVGIHTPEDLIAVGAVEAYRRLKAKFPQVNRTALWALQGALMDLPFNQVPQSVRDELLAELGESD